jgi:hypothetical protein
MRAIKDKFEKLEISRQRKYQLRQKAKGRCVQCGRKLETDLTRCKKCTAVGNALAKAAYRRRVRSGK